MKRLTLYDHVNDLYNVDVSTLDEDSRYVYSHPKFQELLDLDDDELAAKMLSIDVDPDTISRLTGILILMNTAASWKVLGYANDQSVIAAVKSSIATNRRISDLKKTLLDQGRDDVYDLISNVFDEESTYYPEEIVRSIILNTHDIRRLKQLHDTNATYARLLNDEGILQELARWWMNNEPSVKRGGTKAKEPPVLSSFKVFTKWVENNFYSPECFNPKMRWKYDPWQCLSQVIWRGDTEMERWMIDNNYKMDTGDLRVLLNHEQYDVIGRICDLKLCNESTKFVVMVIMGDAEELERLLANDSMMARVWEWILARRTYDKKVMKILLETNRCDNQKYVQFIGIDASAHGDWMPELLRDILRQVYGPSHWYSALIDHLRKVIAERA